MGGFNWTLPLALADIFLTVSVSSVRDCLYLNNPRRLSGVRGNDKNPSKHNNAHICLYQHCNRLKLSSIDPTAWHTSNWYPCSRSHGILRKNPFFLQDLLHLFHDHPAQTDRRILQPIEFIKLNVVFEPLPDQRKSKLRTFVRGDFHS